SPIDALRIAGSESDREVVFLAVGFETTAPAVALAVLQAHELELCNFSILISHVLVPPAMRTILGAVDNRVQGFLAAGHVCTIMGYRQYMPIAERYRVPIVITGFETVDVLNGILACVRMLESDVWGVENEYARVVLEAGNQAAQEMIARVFQTVDRNWRGIATIAESGLALQSAYEHFDARLKFTKPEQPSLNNAADSICISGEILRGIKKPTACPAFGNQCNPDRPLGAPMVSSEGACAAYFRYHRGATHVG
ncbi:MAG: hydrogenase formation protein HypD, partial [Leptospiraceae bacterium]|nr:hydrogenase formation protein HypD [Leptospiraceae bacterium]